MKIVIVTGPFFSVPPGRCGAVERAWFDLAKAFAAKKHQVWVLASGEADLPEREIVEGVRVLRLSRWTASRSLAWNILKDGMYCVDVLRQLPRADVVVSNTFVLPFLALLAKRRVRRFVVSVGRAPKGQFRWYARLGVDRFAAVSRAMRTALEQECPRIANRVCVLPYPIDLEAFRPAAFRPANESSRTILYAGRVHPEKGIALLIAAFRRLDPARRSLRLIIQGAHRTEDGGGGEAYLEKLKLRARGLPIEFRPSVSGRRVFAETLGEANVFCYPSLAEKGESFGVAPLEAMACGTVPVVSALECFREFVEPGITGLVFDHRDPQRVTNLARALRQVLDSQEECRRMAEAGIARAQDFATPAVADRYLADFRELLDQ